MSFPRYADYKDSGVEWLGEVPGHWRAIPIKYLVRFFSGGTPSKENESYWGGDVPWASAKDIKVDAIYDTEDHLTREAISQGAATLLDAGAVLIVVRGMILARTFPVTVTRSPMAINQDLKGIIAGANILPDFLAWYLRGTADESLRCLDEAGHGTKALRMDAWTSLSVALPPLPEQSAIASFLDRETAKIDALVAEQEKLIDLLKEKRQAVISHAVTKGLNPDVPMKDSGIEWLGEVPEHWEVIPLKWFGSCASGDGISPEAVEPEGSEKSVPVIGGNGVMGYTDSPNVTHPIIVIGRVGALCGNVHLVRQSAWVTDNALILDLQACVFEQEYIAHLLRSRNLNEIASKTAQPLITGTQVRDQRVPRPPLSEQAAIGAFLDAETAKLDALTAEARRAIDLLKEHRSALISAAVTGKIDVRGLVMEAEAAA